MTVIPKRNFEPKQLNGSTVILIIVRNTGDGKEIGLIAQEVELVFPNLVLTDPDGKKLINYTALIPVLIDAVKTLTEEINTLKSMQK